MLLKSDSYDAGFYDAEMKIQKWSTIELDKDFTYPNEDVGELDKFEYVRGQVNAILKHIAKD